MHIRACEGGLFVSDRALTRLFVDAIANVKLFPELYTLCRWYLTSRTLHTHIHTVYSPLGSPTFDFARVPLPARPAFVLATALCELLVTALPLLLLPAWLLHLSYWLTPLSHTFVFYYGPFLMWLAVYLRYTRWPEMRQLFHHFITIDYLYRRSFLS